MVEYREGGSPDKFLGEGGRVNVMSVGCLHCWLPNPVQFSLANCRQQIVLRSKKVSIRKRLRFVKVWKVFSSHLHKVRRYI